MQLERRYQPKLIARIQERFPGAVVLKNDPDYIQGIPDVLVLYGPNWAMFETKRRPNSPRRPNQSYYVDLFDRMSFARFIDPTNEEEVFSGLHRTFASF